MIILEKSVPPVYVDESRDFQYFLRAYNVVLNMVKFDADTLQYLTSTDECRSKLFPLLKTKLGFFTNYSMNDELLRGILRAFPLLVKGKGSLEAIQQAVYVFLKSLNIKTEIIIKAVGENSEVVKGSIVVDDHTILIAINSAVQNFYILEELFKYIMPIGYQYMFYFYRELEEESWILNESTGKFLIVNTLISDSIRSENIYNQNFANKYIDPEVDRLVNQVSLMNVTNAVTDTNEFTMVAITGDTPPVWFDEYYQYLYVIESGKYRQIKQEDRIPYSSGTFFIPQFLFINEEDTYELLTSDPTFEYKGGTESLLNWEYFNYYEKNSNGKFVNLQEPATFVANKYYKAKDSVIYVKAVASDVNSYSAIPVTSKYIVAVSNIAQQ